MNSLLNERRFGPTPELLEAIERVLMDLKLWGNWRALGQAVSEMSTHFIEKRGQTPWNTPAFQAAYLIYFLPLNHARLQAVFYEAKTLGLPLDSPIVDIGSGPGTAHLAAQAQGLNPSSWLNWEASASAIELHKKILGRDEQGISWSREKPKFKNTMVVASYALNEMSSWPTELFECEHLIILEPSTQDSGRRLMEFRARAIENGFSIWAPCTHQLACPLLTQSKRDWCHDRIFFKAPSWWGELQAFVPMKNDTLTFSYLIASKFPRPMEVSVAHHPARIIGDTLFEKGKIRQAICRGPEREFLSWLKKAGPVTQLPHGQLIELPDIVEKKGNELRLQPNRGSISH